MKRILVLILLVLAFTGPGAADAFGCPVCYGDSDEQIVKGAEVSVLFMVGLTYLLLMGGGVLAFVLYRRRARRLMDARREPASAASEPALEGA